MDRDPQMADQKTRGLRWHATRRIAAFAIGFSVFIVGMVTGLFLAGPDFVEKWWGGLGGAVMWGTALVSLPLVYRKLRS